MSSVASMRMRIADFCEPIMVLEMRRLSRRKMWLMVVAGLVLLGLPSVAAIWQPDSGMARMTLATVAALYLFVMVAVVPAYGMKSISKEKESGTFDILATTSLTSTQIAEQKIFAASIPMLVLIAAGLPGSVVLTLFGGASAVELVTVFLALCLATLGLSAWSVECSSDCGSGMVWLAYITLAFYLLPFLVPAAFMLGIFLLLFPNLRVRVGRLLGAGICVLLICGVLGAPYVFVRVGVFPTNVAALALPMWVLAVQIVALIGMRLIVAGSIEESRRIT